MTPTMVLTPNKTQVGGRECYIVVKVCCFCLAGERNLYS